MKRPLLLGVFLAAFLINVSPASASSPTITGEISGVELCPQFICDAAVFQGTCDCLVNNRHTIGFFWVSVQHDTLPQVEGFQAPIIGGSWTLTILRGNFSGKVVDGLITKNENNTFTVDATLRLRKNGKGDVLVSGTLDHTEFPPTFDGFLLQPLGQ
jgi:hypothetical protein